MHGVRQQGLVKMHGVTQQGLVQMHRARQQGLLQTYGIRQQQLLQMHVSRQTDPCVQTDRPMCPGRQTYAMGVFLPCAAFLKVAPQFGNHSPEVTAREARARS